MCSPEAIVKKLRQKISQKYRSEQDLASCFDLYFYVSLSVI